MYAIVCNKPGCPCVDLLELLKCFLCSRGPIQPYKTAAFGHTSVLYVMGLISGVQLCRFLLRNPSVLLALLVMVNVCYR